MWGVLICSWKRIIVWIVIVTINATVVCGIILRIVLIGARAIFEYVFVVSVT